LRVSSKCAFESSPLSHSIVAILVAKETLASRLQQIRLKTRKNKKKHPNKISRIMVLDDNQKIGVGLITLGLGFVVLGVILFFDAAMIAIGNILFLVGLCFSIGVKRSLSLFTRYKLQRALCNLRNDL
jgi:hypothetical protein